MSEHALPGPSGLPEIPLYAERVLETAELIPPGRVMTYGDVAEWLTQEDEELREARAAGAVGGPGAPTGTDRPRLGPRQVGRAMALYGGSVPWWRVVRSDGALLPGHEARALEHYRAEGTPLRDPARPEPGRYPRVDMRRARWDGSGTGSVPEGATGPDGPAGRAADGPDRAGGTGPELEEPHI
ncbi:MGMT family protein [Streptomyces sp. NPDC097619]|uniref:MGMT family protein n=1 Tax=Streptomyces sp. NPDC097619 TaxID=3157228 RepID=UPI003324A8CB